MVENKYWALKLTAIIVFIHFIKVLVGEPFTELFVLNYNTYLLHPWTLVSSVFLHSNMGHLLVNGLMLALFGSILESIIGSKRFLTLFFAAGIVASFAAIFLHPIQVLIDPSNIFVFRALGASGAIYGIFGALMVIRPRMIVWLHFPVPMWMAGIIYILQDLLGLFLPDNIGHFAHLGGLFFGLFFGLALIKKYKEKRKKSVKKDIMITKEEFENWEKQTFNV